MKGKFKRKYGGVRFKYVFLVISMEVHILTVMMPHQAFLIVPKVCGS
jgi:hypothetical protein